MLLTFWLTSILKVGYQYSSLGAYRSAIASLHTPADGASIGQHPLVSRLLKGVFIRGHPFPVIAGRVMSPEYCLT